MIATCSLRLRIYRAALIAKYLRGSSITTIISSLQPNTSLQPNKESTRTQISPPPQITDHTVQSSQHRPPHKKGHDQRSHRCFSHLHRVSETSLGLSASTDLGTTSDRSGDKRKNGIYVGHDHFVWVSWHEGRPGRKERKETPNAVCPQPSKQRT